MQPRVLLTGPLADQNHIAHLKKQGFLEFKIIDDPAAIRQTIKRGMGDERFLLVTGSFATDLARFNKHASGPLSVGLEYSADRGRIQIDSKQNITRFSEAADDGYLNTGIFSITREALELWPEGATLESALPTFLDRGRLKGIPCAPVAVGIPAQPCLFLDRDGIIVEHIHHLHKIEDCVMIPETLEFTRFAKKHGWRVVVTTNQSGVGRGIFTEQQCRALNAHIDREMIRAGAQPDYWQACFEHPREGVGQFKRDSLRRKPKPGMHLEVCAKFAIDLSRSLMIGDNATDQIELPGLRTILVKGDFELTGIREGTIVTSNFTELKLAAQKMIAELT